MVIQIQTDSQFYKEALMNAVIKEDGLYNTLKDIEGYLKEALNIKNINKKNEYISKSYGAVVAINRMIDIVEDDVNNEEEYRR